MGDISGYELCRQREACRGQRLAEVEGAVQGEKPPGEGTVTTLDFAPLKTYIRNHGDEPHRGALIMSLLRSRRMRNVLIGMSRAFDPAPINEIVETPVKRRKRPSYDTSSLASIGLLEDRVKGEARFMAEHRRARAMNYERA